MKQGNSMRFSHYHFPCFLIRKKILNYLEYTTMITDRPDYPEQSIQNMNLIIIMTAIFVEKFQFIKHNSLTIQIHTFGSFKLLSQFRCTILFNDLLRIYIHYLHTFSSQFRNEVVKCSKNRAISRLFHSILHKM